MLEHMFKCPFEMAQQVSREPGVVPAALPSRDPRSLSSDTLPPAMCRLACSGGGVPSSAALQARAAQRQPG
jgi:hypothetical protein